ncbi:hypothetical protein [Streptomyces sp. NPDC058486]|uniref:hypothetical protein n=1 Tax=unclassified Streptomyces TaxID=2593676 RepID=UPI00364E1B67
MSFRTPRRSRPQPLRHVPATGTALVVALGPVVVGALLARSVGGDPMVSVNALIAGGGHRARVSRDHLRSCGGRMNARRVQAVRGLRARTKRLDGRQGQLTRRRARTHRTTTQPPTPPPAQNRHT